MNEILITIDQMSAGGKIVVCFISLVFGFVAIGLFGVIVKIIKSEPIKIDKGRCK